MIEDLVVGLGRHRFHRRDDLIDVSTQLVGQEPDLAFEQPAVEGQEIIGGRADLIDRLAKSHVVERD